MRYRICAVLISGLIAGQLSGCASAPPQAGTPQTCRTVAGLITPQQAISLAADVAPGCITGTFDLVVRGSGREKGQVFLNSEADYRDQRSISIEISARAVAELESLYGGKAEAIFAGKHIQVRGPARRVQVWFVVNGQRTSKYYFQTHVYVDAATQITLIP